MPSSLKSRRRSGLRVGRYYIHQAGKKHGRRLLVFAGFRLIENQRKPTKG